MGVAGEVAEEHEAGAPEHTGNTKPKNNASSAKTRQPTIMYTAQEGAFRSWSTGVTTMVAYANLMTESTPATKQ
jgi:hypothetical protein